MTTNNKTHEIWGKVIDFTAFDPQGVPARAVLKALKKLKDTPRPKNKKPRLKNRGS